MKNISTTCTILPCGPESHPNSLPVPHARRPILHKHRSSCSWVLLHPGHVIPTAWLRNGPGVLPGSSRIYPFPAGDTGSHCSLFSSFGVSPNFYWHSLFSEIPSGFSPIRTSYNWGYRPGLHCSGWCSSRSASAPHPTRFAWFC